MNNPLLDLNFLHRLDLVKNKAIYAKIILLTWNEEPVEEIQGKITAGSINVDGASAIRRTCSFTMVSNNVNINNTYWTLKNKFKLEIGVENIIETQYPSIIWFKQGIFVFTSLNLNVQSNNFTISVNGKDKGCLLNGEVGGALNASIDFGKLEEYSTLNNGEIVRNIIDIPIIDIIKNAVHVYGGEPIHNIIINDVDNYGLELLEYRGDNNLYLPRKVGSGEVSNIIINKKQLYYLSDGSEVYVDNEENKQAGNKEIIYYDRSGLNNIIATKVWTTPGNHSSNDLNAYNIIKVEYGETAGYRRTDLTYPGELVANIGESITSILDKIKNMLGDFEYFYDIDGKFIFQKKKTYFNTSFNNLEVSENGIYAKDMAYTSSEVYSFENGVLLSAFQTTPQILNIKNDFSIWGKRKSVTGAELPVHMRYAIDFKPTSYTPLRFIYKKVSLNENQYKANKYYTRVLDKYYVLETSETFDENKTYYVETDEQDFDIPTFTSDEYDWREIIYQMAVDYFKYNHKLDNFYQLIAAANPEQYPTGITGYETYYTDIQGFWRDLYHPGAMSYKGADKYYDLFTKSELYEAARELILRERQFIENEDIAQLFIDYVYKHFDEIRNELIYQVDYAEQIEKYIAAGVDSNSLIIQELLELRWQKLDGKDPYNYNSLLEQEKNAFGTNTPWYQTLLILKDFKDKQEMLDTDYAQQIMDLIEEGYSISSYRIQELLALRWAKLDGLDLYDYDELIEKSETDSEKTTYQILKAYRDILSTQVGSENDDIAGKIKVYIENNTLQENAIAIQILLALRWKKMGNKDDYDYEALKQQELENPSGGINSAQYKLLEILDTFKKQTIAINEDIAEIITDYVRIGFNENTTIIQELLYLRWKKLNENDTYDYQQLMSDYLKQENTSKKDPEYKTLQILNNYKIQKTNEDGGYDESIDYAKAIEEEIENGASEESYAVQQLLLIRWLKMDGQDTEYDYLQLMEEEYIANEESARYKALLAMYNFKNSQQQKAIDTSHEYFEQLGENEIRIKDDYLIFLYNSRHKKISKQGVNSKALSNERFLQIILQVMKNLKIKKVEFKDQVLLMFDQQINKSAYDFFQELLDYICENYNKRPEFFCVGLDDKIYVEDLHIQYLLNMRQEKMDESGGDGIYIDNSLLVITMLELFETCKNPEAFLKAITEKIEQAYTPLDKNAYDFTAEIVDYIYVNYENKDMFFDIAEDETVSVQDQYLKFLLLMRQDKINSVYGQEYFYPQNNDLIGLFIETIENDDKEKFKEEINVILEKMQNQLTDSNYDFAGEIINYIYINYAKKDTFFIKTQDGKVSVLNQYIQHLLNLRQKKLESMSNVGVKNLEFVRSVITAIENSETAEEFKNTMNK